MLRSPLSRGAVSRVLGEAGKPPLFILPLTLTLTYTLRSESSSMFIGVLYLILKLDCSSKSSLIIDQEANALKRFLLEFSVFSGCLLPTENGQEIPVYIIYLVAE